MNLPALTTQTLAEYLRLVADWLESEERTLSECSVKTWPAIGSIHIMFKAEKAS